MYDFLAITGHSDVSTNDTFPPDPMDELPFSWDFMDHYLAGDASPEERAAIDSWLAADEAHVATLSRLSRIVRDTYPYADVIDAERGWAQIAARWQIRDGVETSETSDRRPLSPTMPSALHRRFFMPIAMAATAVLTLVAGWQFMGSRTTSSYEQSVTEYTTTNGQRTTVQLDDGTTVLLNVASSLRVPRDFGTRTRTVQLDGEARFSVTHQGSTPLIVDAGGAKTTVLGTIFNVRAYAGEGTMQVFVVDGKVSVRPVQVTVPQMATLTRGELVAITAGNGPVVSEPGNPDQYLAWTKGQLIFDRTPVTQVLTELSRWYDIDISLADSTLASRHLSARFDARSMQSVNGVLSVIATALNAQYRWNGRVVYFAPLP